MTTTTTTPTGFPVAGTNRPQPLRDSLTMLDRQLRHMLRYPEMTVILLVVPIIFLLLFVYVFGGTLGAGLAPGGGDRGDYVNYVVPGILLLTIATVAAGTATSVSMDMAAGIIARFRTMAISPGSVLTGHALGSLLQSLGSLVVILAVALLVGFRPDAGVTGWLGATALLAGLALAIGWLSVALGLLARSPETASNSPMLLSLLPFLGSGFVPSESMPAGLAWFAEHQPFTPIMDTLRALLLGTGVDAATAWTAVGWCVALTVIGYAWSRRLYARPRKA